MFQLCHSAMLIWVAGDLQTNVESTFEVRPNPAWDAAVRSLDGRLLAMEYRCFMLHKQPAIWTQQGEFWEVVEPATKYMELDERERFRELETETPLETLTFLGSVNFTWQDVKTADEEAIADEGIEPVPEGSQPAEPAQPVQDVQPLPQILPHADREFLQQGAKQS